MNSKTKILIGAGIVIGILAVILLVSFFCPKPCGSESKCIGIRHNINSCPPNTFCGLPDPYCYGLCISPKKVQNTQAQITESKVIAIAKATEEVKEFLKLYPDADLTAFQTGWCDMMWQVRGVYVKCGQEIDKLTWVVSYHKGEGWQPTNAVAVKLGIDAKTGEISAKYPKPEYIKNKTYCENDGECLCASCCGGCADFIYVPLIKAQSENILCYACSCATGDNCKCVNNACGGGYKHKTIKVVELNYAKD